MATTIGGYKVTLGLDARDYITGSSLSRGETAKLARIINEAKSPADKFATSLSLLERAYKGGAIDGRTYNAVLERMRNNLNQVSTAGAKTTNVMRGLANAVVALGLLRLARESIGLAIAMEQANAKFEIFTGSANNAQVVLRDLREFAAKSPITFSGAQDAASSLLQFGITTQQLMPTIRMLGEVAGGNQLRFERLTLAFGQMTAAGRLTGMEFRQMTESGFSPLVEISKRTGESFAELKERMEAGGISTQEVVQAFQDAVAEGGRFHGLTDKLADTMGGRLAIAMSRLEEAGADVGFKLEPLLTALTDGFAEGESAIQGVLWVVGKLADGLGFIVAILKDVAQGFALVGKGLSGGGWENLEIDNINAFLDALDKRDRELSNPKAKATRLDDIAAKQQADAEAAERAAKMKVATAALEEANKKAMDFEKKFQETRQKGIAKALDAARDHFAKERELQMRRQKDIVGMMSGAGAEAGSAEATRFLAQQQNALLAKQSQPAAVEPTEAQILAEAKKQHAVLLAQEALQTQQAVTLTKILDATLQNGFKRIR